MLKRILSIALVFALVLSCTFFVQAEKSPPTSLEKPQSPALWQSHESTLEFRWTNPPSILQVTNDVNDAEYHATFSYLIDWKKNDGNWNVAVPTSDPIWDDSLHGQFSGNMPNVMFDENGVAETFFVTWHLDPTQNAASAYDLKNNTYYFRIRYLLEAYDGEFEPVYSSYSDTAAIGKDAESKKITELAAPKELKAVVMKDSNGKPYFQLNWIIPESVTEANKLMPVHHIIDFKIGDGKWLSENHSWDWLPTAPSGLFLSTDTFDPVDIGLADEVVIEENIYSFRVAYVCEQPTGAPVISAYSNVASTRMEAYSNASPWAKPELDSAAQNGLIPKSLIGADMTKSITREEFAELSVKLYEKTLDIVATPASLNPFTDTKNPEILKALEIGVTTGFSATTFEPKKLINREQVATMLSRAIRKMVPDGDFSTIGAPTFTDQKDISAWALDHVLYMSKLGIIKGTDGKFMPKAITTAQVAAGYANTTREQAVAMSLRTYNQIKAK